jgi:transaldolase
MEKVPDRDRDKLGVAIGQQTYKAYCYLLDSDRWQRLANSGARVQRFAPRTNRPGLPVLASSFVAHRSYASTSLAPVCAPARTVAP